MNQVQEYLAEHKVDYVPAVVCYPLEGNSVCLGLRVKVSNGLGEGIFAGPGGKHEVKADGSLETSEEALIREVQQELNVTPSEFQSRGTIRFIFPSKPKWCMQVDIFAVTKWDGEINDVPAAELQVYLKSLVDQLKPSEDLPEIIPVKFTLDQIPFNQMWPDNEIWVPKVISGETINMTFIYDEAGKQVVDWMEN